MQFYPSLPVSHKGVPVGRVTSWIIVFAYIILTLPSQWVKTVLPYYGDVIFALITSLVALPYVCWHKFWIGSSKWPFVIMLYGMMVTWISRGLENAWAIGWREFTIDIIILCIMVFGMKLAEASFDSLRTIISRISWVCILLGVMNIVLLRLGIVRLDLDPHSRIVSVTLFYACGPLLFLVPLQFAFRLGLLLPTLSVIFVGFIAWFTLTRSIAIAFFLLFAQWALFVLRRVFGSFSFSFTAWMFLILPLIAGVGYYMLDSITSSRGIEVMSTSGRDVEFDEFLAQMSIWGWIMGNGVGTGFLMMGYDPLSGQNAEVVCTGLHYSTLTPVLKFGIVIMGVFWLTLLYHILQLLSEPCDVEQKAVILVPLNYMIVYSISGAWLASSQFIIALGIALIYNSHVFVMKSAAIRTPNEFSVLHHRHRHL